MLVGDILEHNARVFPEKEAVVCDDEVLTYRQLKKRVDYLTALFREMGVRRGEPVAVLTRNSPRYVEILFALAGMGAITSPLNFFLLPPELIRILQDLEPRFLFFEKKFVDSVDAIKEYCPYLEKLVCIDGDVSGYPPLAALMGRGYRSGAAGDFLDESDVAFISYAGSIGKNPKGAQLTHRNLMCASYFSALELNISRSDVYLSTASLPFLAGAGRMMKFFLPGAKVVIMRIFEPELALKLIEKHRVTQLLLVPQMMAQLASEARKGKHDISSLKKISYSGIIPVDPLLLKEAMSIFHCGFVQSFAQVESSGNISFLNVNEEMGRDDAVGLRRLSSIGKEAVGIRVKVIDSSGVEIVPNMVGELAVRGPTVMKGYYNDPYLTAEKVKNGWLYTGHIASIDEGGYIYVIDRLRDIIIRGGVPVDPAEVEEILLEHGAVDDVSVISKPDYECGEVPVAIVVLKEGATIEKSEILAYARSNMAPFKVPASIEYTESLPRNSQGKILKARIKEDMKGRGFLHDKSTGDAAAIASADPSKAQ
ncbi:MAG: AMP-binding protein [Deltaproteobacteria bacterium]|nr:AMP-binding protein [Deltaproteobacteria bacterium]NIS77603.1 AMP-binding protein [Deltaproteobacteria bacterium]